MSFGVKSLLTPDKVGPKEASGRVLPPQPGLLQAEEVQGGAFVCEMVPH